MNAPHRVVLTGLGLCSPLGQDPDAVADALWREVSALRPSRTLEALANPLAGVVDGPDLKAWLRRRKDAKLLPRSAELALAAAGRALAGWSEDRGDLGLFLGVGREPPDEGESEACLIASCEHGRLSDRLLAGPGRDLYPPLLPLKTLPNMALAHVSINLGLMGENAAWAGGLGAGCHAMHAGWWAVAEGRCAAALVGGTDSLVDLGNARDRLRLGEMDPPGEAAAVLLLEREDLALQRGARPLALAEALYGDEARTSCPSTSALRAAMGCTGAAEGPLGLMLALCRITRGAWGSPRVGEDRVAWAGSDGALAPTGMALRVASPTVDA